MSSYRSLKLSPSPFRSLPSSPASSPPPSPTPSPPPSPKSPEMNVCPVSRFLWKGCSGKFANIPAVGSMVYYFPQGHVEQCIPPPDLSSVRIRKRRIISHVVSVQFLADKNTSEVFAKISVDPRVSSPEIPIAADLDDGEVEEASAPKFISHYDVYGTGGMDVTKLCAERVFPEFDCEKEKSEQLLTVRDVMGTEWEFTYTCTGKPLRYKLTKGWKDFAQAKQLHIGDGLVFFKKGNGALFVGIRPSFARRRRVLAEDVVEALRAAEASDRVFEVEWYVSYRSSEFLVPVEKVDQAMEVKWAPGMKVRMRRVIEFDWIIWHEGTVLAAEPVETEGIWAMSPWRILKV